MRVVSLAEFVKLPVGTIYSEYVPAMCNGLFKKGETISNLEEDGPSGAADFFYQSLLGVVDYRSESPGLNADPTRWGEFDHSAQFAVYEPSEVANIKEELS